MFTIGQTLISMITDQAFFGWGGGDYTQHLDIQILGKQTTGDQFRDLE